MYGQMTAGSWIYIGTQGILQGTYETFAQAGRTHFGSDGSRRAGWCSPAASAAWAGAQPLAATMNGAVFLGVEVDPAARPAPGRDALPGRRGQATSTRRWRWRRTRSRARSRPLHRASSATRPTCSRSCAGAASKPDLVTDQTSAHDPLNGYIPRGPDAAEAAAELRQDATRGATCAGPSESMAVQVQAMLDFQSAGSHVFDYGNNIRAQAQQRRAWRTPSTSPASCPRTSGRCSARARGPSAGWRSPAIRRTSAAPIGRCWSCSRRRSRCARWITLAQRARGFQGLPARICWLGYGERAKAGLAFNELVRKGEVKAPIVIGRDHLDCGSVASPNRETEAMKDGSDAVADWPILNALVNAVNGASLGVLPPRRRRGHRLLAARRPGHRRRRHAGGGAAHRARAHLGSGHGRAAPRRRGLRGGRGGGAKSAA